MARQSKMPLADVARYSTILATHRTILESTQTGDRLGKIEERLEQMVLAERFGVRPSLDPLPLLASATMLVLGEQQAGRLISAM